jgi:hypothetical protein
VTRAELEHVIRAAAAIADDPVIVVVGSQAVLGQYPDAPDEMLRSREADVYPKNHPERSALIEGSIGELSPFHDTFGYYAEGVSPQTAKLPTGWETRLIEVRVDSVGGGVVQGLCLEIHDLVLSKWAAGREKDLDYARAAIRHRLVQRETLLERLPSMPLEARHRTALCDSVESIFRSEDPGLR